MSDVVSPVAAAVIPAGPQRAGLTATSRPWALAALTLTLVVAAMESTLVATAMPAIVGTLGGFDLFSWVFAAFLLAQAVSIPTYGRLADLFGRKRVLLSGIGLFLLGSVLCGCAWDMPSLIGARAVQGLGAGSLIPVSLTIFGDIYTPSERARVQGVLSAAWTIAAVLGPVAGAFLIGHGTWPFVFWFNVPIGLAAAVLLAVTLRERGRSRRHHIDYVGTVLITVGTGVLMFAFSQAPSLGTGTIAALVGGGLAALAALFAYERRALEPILPPALWRDSAVVGGSVSCVGMGMVNLGTSVF
ncbi:MAG: MFS transporter, partial [Alphaproteobacteria bacterium]|nr:MFS transporter [Alphaproteobacteria bacterium]